MNVSTKFCDNCGEANRSDARFCYACGHPQTTYTSTATGLLSTSYQLKQRYTILEKPTRQQISASQMAAIR